MLTARVGVVELQRQHIAPLLVAQAQGFSVPAVFDSVTRPLHCVEMEDGKGLAGVEWPGPEHLKP